MSWHFSASHGRSAGRRAPQARAHEQARCHRTTITHRAPDTVTTQCQHPLVRRDAHLLAATHVGVHYARHDACVLDVRVCVDMRVHEHMVAAAMAS